MSPTTAKATPTQPVAQTPAPAKPETKTPPAEPQLPASYNYVAQSGDSYTMFIRDALNQYLNAKKISATPEQMFSAEVTLLSEANSPLLDIGQQVSIPQQSVTNALRSSGVAI